MLPTEHLTDTNYAEAKQFLQSRDLYGIDVIAPTRADNKWQAKEKLGFDASSFAIDWQAHTARCAAGQESISWTPAIDNYSNEVIKIKFSRARLQTVSTQRTLYQSPASSDLETSPRAPSGATRSTSSSKRRPILGDLSVQIWNRRNDFTGSASLWYASYSLSGHAENALSAPDVCGLSQLGTCFGLARRATTRSNPHFSLCCFSFCYLSQEVRQQ